MTAYHVVADAIRIQVFFEALDGVPYDAHTVLANPELDVALLATVQPISNRDKIKGFQVGSSDTLRRLHTVKALGFALGSPHLQTTAGIISGRITAPPRLQIDVAVNPGNSGGPLLDNKARVVGIITSGIRNAQNVNFAAPIQEVIELFNLAKHRPDKLSRIGVGSTNRVSNEKSLISTSEHGRTIKVIPRPIAKPPAPGQDNDYIKVDGLWFQKNRAITFQPLSSLNIGLVKLSKYYVEALDSVNDLQGVESKRRIRSGAYVSYVHPLLQEESTTDSPKLRVGDIVTHIDDRALDMQLRVSVDYWDQPLPWRALIDREPLGHKVKLSVVKNGVHGKTLVDIPLRTGQELCAYRTIFSQLEEMPYFNAGGLVVMPLLRNHEQFEGHFQMMMTQPNVAVHSLLIITHIYPESPFNEGDITIGTGDIVDGINNSNVDSFKDFVAKWQEAMGAGNSLLTLHMRDRNLCTARVQDIIQAETEMRRIYGQ